MSNIERLAAFRHISDSLQASALSEPFLNPDSFISEIANATESLEFNAPLAVGAAYITGNTVSYGFGLSADAERPFYIAQTFAEEYEHRVSPYHVRAMRTGLTTPETLDEAYTGENRAAQRAGQVARESGLTTIAAFAILKVSNPPKLIAHVYVPRTVVQTVPGEGAKVLRGIVNDPLSAAHERFTAFSRDVAPASSKTRDEVTQAMLDDNSRENQEFGMMVAALWLPRATIARRRVSDDNRVAGFLESPRSERRKLLQKERKGAR